MRSLTRERIGLTIFLSLEVLLQELLLFWF